jgi:outer membrane protein TolC
MVIQRFFSHLLLAGALAGSASAQEPAATPLDLAGAMGRARGQALDVAAARARESAAAHQVRQAKSFHYPKLRVQETWMRTDSPAEAFALLLNQERFSFADFVTGDPNSPETLDTAITRLELELPLWTGGEISTRVRQAELAAEAAAATAGQTGDGAALAAAEAWVRLAQAREYAALLGKARETVAAHVELARSYAEQGMLVRSELLRAEVELARVDDLLAEARGQGRVAEANLAFRLGDPLGTTYELAELGGPPVLAGARERWLESASSRRDLEAARKLLAAGELEAKARAALWWPRVGLVARHDLVDDRLFGDHGDSSAIFAVASWELSLGGERRAAVLAARAQAEAGRHDLARFEEGVRLEVRQAFEQAEVALERRATASQALDAADEAVRITEQRFRAGVVRTIDLLDAVTARREAETRELVARADAHLAALRLAVQSGHAPETVLAAHVTAPVATPQGEAK